MNSLHFASLGLGGKKVYTTVASRMSKSCKAVPLPTTLQMELETIRDFCLGLPHTSEGIKYGDQLCFMVAGKSFCSANVKTLEKLKFKVPDDDFEILCEREGLGPAPYGGAKFKWVQVDNFLHLSDKEWLFFIQQSYDLVKNSLPKKVLAAL